MRSPLALAAAVALAACSTTRARFDRAGGDLASGAPVDTAARSGSGVPTYESMPPALPAPRSAAVLVPVAPPPSLPAGPMTAGDLAREQGLDVRDAGSNVLLEGGDLRARLYPGDVRMMLDGGWVTMAAPARRESAGFVVPADGVAAVRRAVARAREKKAESERRALVLAPLYAPPRIVPTPCTAKPVVPGVQPGPGWVVAAPERPWRWIVVHHSDDTCGCCSKYDLVHRSKGWENGCGYHFVIGNGSMTGDGQVEASGRWREQLVGAHAKTPDNRYNDFGIGVVLVGDFEHGGGPSARQYESLLRLVRWLMQRYGIAADHVLRHGDTKATACPGRNFPWSRFVADVSAPPAATPP